MDTQPPHQCASQLEQFLGPDLTALIGRAAALAEQQHATLYVVGGTVRDMLLGRPHSDIDLAVVGDAPALAAALAAETGGALLSHAVFGTATLTIGETNVLELDFATARRETYAHPAALPQPTPATLQDDLFRRDFTINALAICVSPACYGQLIDLYGGLRDLQQRQLRVLHDESFIDDPTRILRGARFAARLGFAFEPHTTRLAAAALVQGMFERTSPQRLANELRLLFHESQPEQCIALLQQWGALLHLLPDAQWSVAQAQQWVAARQQTWPGVSLARLYFGIAVYPLSAAQHGALIARYQPAVPIMRLLQDLERLQSRLPALRAAERNSQIDQVLRGIDETALRTAQIVEPAPIPKLIERYIAELRPTTLAVDGTDVLALGVPRGPQIGRLLAELRAVVLDGAAATREAQIAWLRRRIIEQ